MSLETDRQALSDAVSEVDGITGYVYPPDEPTPGDAWPQLTLIDMTDSPFDSVLWSVVVVLGTTNEEAARTLSDRHADLTEAIAEVMPINDIRPGRLSTPGATYLAAEFNGRMPL